MCSAELLSSSHQSGTASPCGGSTQGNHSSSGLFYSLLSLFDLATIDEATTYSTPWMRADHYVWQNWTRRLSVGTHLGCLFIEKRKWVYSERRDLKLRVAFPFSGAQNGNMPPCFSLDVKILFLDFVRPSRTSTNWVVSLVPESPQLLSLPASLLK